jgi:hypothetical protein
MTSTTLGYSASYPWIAVDPKSHMVFVGSNAGAGSDLLYEVNPFATGGPVSAGYGNSESDFYTTNGFVVPNPNNANYGELVLVGGANPNSGFGNTTAPFSVADSYDISQFTVSNDALNLPSPLVNLQPTHLEPAGPSDLDRVDDIVYAVVTDISSSQQAIAALNLNTQQASTVFEPAFDSFASVSQIVYAAPTNFIYWVEADSYPSTININEFQLSGSPTAPITLFTTNTGSISDLTVDQTNGKLYAVDGSNILIFDPPVGSVHGTPPPPAPQISSISPNYGAPGATIQIAGTGFGATQGNSTVTVGGAAASIVSWSNTAISISVPGGAVTGNIVVTVGAVASNGEPFTFYPAPAITGISPLSGPVGATVTVTGLLDGGNKATVAFNGTSATILSDTATSIEATVPVGATTGPIAVHVNGVTVSSSAFTVLTPLQFIPITPCRIADTRNPTGPFGGPEPKAGSTTTFDIPESECKIPNTAVAY